MGILSGAANCILLELMFEEIFYSFIENIY
jgi:hypothetical protein